MAIDPKALVYGGREGSGAAQIFDTRGATKWETAKIQQQAEQRAQEQEQLKSALEDIDTSIEANEPWSVDHEIYSDMVSNLVDMGAEIQTRAQMEGKITPEVRGMIKEFERKKTEAETFANYSAQQKGIYDKYNFEYSKNKDKYKKESVKYQLQFKKPIEYDGSNSFEAGKSLMTKRSNVDEDLMLQGRPDAFDFAKWQDHGYRNVKEGAKETGNWYPSEDKDLLITEKNTEYFEDNAKEYVKNTYLADKTAEAYFNDIYKDEIKGKSKEERAEIVADKAFDLVFPEDKVDISVRGASSDSGGWGYGKSDEELSQAISRGSFKKVTDNLLTDWSPASRERLFESAKTLGMDIDMDAYTPHVSVKMPSTRLVLKGARDVFTGKKAGDSARKAAWDEVTRQTQAIMEFYDDKGKSMTEEEVGEYIREKGKLPEMKKYVIQAGHAEEFEKRPYRMYKVPYDNIRSELTEESREKAAVLFEREQKDLLNRYGSGGQEVDTDESVGQKEGDGIL